jgi:hypothetical protein
MAFIYQEKKSKTWYVDYNLDGKRIRDRVGRSKQAAKLHLKRVEHDLAFDRKKLARSTTTVVQLLKEYDRFIRNSLGQKTVKKYREVMQHFRAHLGNRGTLSSDLTGLLHLTTNKVDCVAPRVTTNNRDRVDPFAVYGVDQQGEMLTLRISGVRFTALDP